MPWKLKNKEFFREEFFEGYSGETCFEDKYDNNIGDKKIQ